MTEFLCKSENLGIASENRCYAKLFQNYVTYLLPSYNKRKTKKENLNISSSSFPIFYYFCIV